MGRPTVPAGYGSTSIDEPSRERVMCTCGCGGVMVTRFDAIGNMLYRCPKRVVRREGVRIAPEHAFVPVRLVRESEAAARMLPAIKPGQLRCQVCACGVDGNARFCERDRRARSAAGARHFRRERQPKVPRTITCLNCGSVKPRRFGRSTSRDCSDCAPAVGTRTARVYSPKPCGRCGAMFTPTGPAAKWHPGGCP